MTDVFAGDGGGSTSGVEDVLADARRRQEQTTSIQQDMLFNSRLDLVNRYLPGFTEDADIAFEIVGSDLNDDDMMLAALDVAGETYLSDQISYLNELGEGAAQAYYNSAPSSIKNSLLGAGFVPPEERGGGGGWLSAASIPFTGRLERGINFATRQLPGVESGPFDGSNVTIGGVARIPGAIAANATGLRPLGKGLGFTLSAFDSMYRTTTRIYRTGVLAGDRNSYRGLDDDGRPIYDFTALDGSSIDDIVQGAGRISFGALGDAAQEVLTNPSGQLGRSVLSATMPLGDGGAFGTGVISSISNPSSLWQAWGSASDGEETFLTKDIQDAAAILASDASSIDQMGSDLWIARKMAGGHTPSEIVDAMGIAQDDPKYLEEVTKIYNLQIPDGFNEDGSPILGSFSQALETLQGGKISYGREAARSRGLDPESGAGRYLSGFQDAMFMVVMDPTNLAGGGITKARKLTRWRLLSLGEDGISTINRYNELSEFVRLADSGADVGGIRKGLRALRDRGSGSFFSMETLRVGTDLRQARRTNAWVDRISDGYKRLNEMPKGPDRSAAVSRFFDENASLFGVTDQMTEFNNASLAAGGEGLGSIEGVWAFMADEAGQRGIMSTRMGGVRHDIRELPQFGRSDAVRSAVKNQWRKSTDPQARTLGSRLNQILGLSYKKSGEFEHVTDYIETVSKIEEARIAKTLNIERRSRWARLRGKRLQVDIDGVEHLDVDELLNWTIDSKGGSMRRFARSFFQHQTRGNQLPLTTSEGVEEFRRLADSGTLGHMSQHTIDRYIGEFIEGGEATRALVVESFVGDVFFRAGLGAYEDGAGEAFWSKFVGKHQQSFSIRTGDEFVNQGIRTRGGLFTKQFDDVIMIPNFVEMAKATRAMNSHRMLFGALNPNWVDRFVSKVWSPLQLLRIGFIPRAAGEEVLAFMLRRSPGEYVRSRAQMAGTGIRRSRRAGQPGQAAFVDTTKVHELSVTRPINWILNQVSEWGGVRGERWSLLSTQRAMENPAWSRLDAVGRQTLMAEVGQEILNERRFRTSLGTLDEWIEAKSRLAGGGIHRISRMTGIPSKQKIADALLAVKNRKLTGGVSARWADEAEKGRSAYRMMLTDPVMSRQLQQYIGHTYDPWINRSDSLILDSSPTGQVMGASTPQIIPFKVDISKFKDVDRVEDLEGFLTNYSAILKRFLDDPQAQPAIAVLNRYMPERVQERLGRMLDGAPLQMDVEAQVVISRTFDRTAERSVELSDEIGEMSSRANELDDLAADAWKSDPNGERALSLETELDGVLEELSLLEHEQTQYRAGLSYMTEFEETRTVVRTEMPEGLDRIYRARAAWRDLTKRDVETITKAIDGDITRSQARTILENAGYNNDSFAVWILNNNQFFDNREWVALTDVTGEMILTQEALRGEMRAVMETVGRQERGGMDRALQLGLDEGGQLAAVPARGNQYNYIPMIDQKLAPVLRAVGMDPKLRLAFRDRLIEKLRKLGYGQADARGIARAAYKSIDVENTDSLIQLGMKRIVGSESSQIPMSFFSHTDSRVGQAMSEAFTDIGGPMAGDILIGTTPSPSSVSRIEVPKKIRDTQVEGMERWGTGRILRDEWMLKAQDVDPRSATKIRVIENADGVREARSMVDEIPEGWTVVDEILSDGTPMDEAIRKLAVTQTEEILDTLTTFRRGSDDVLLELTAPIARRDTKGITGQAIAERSNIGDLPQHAYGPTIISPKNFTRSSIWSAMVRGGFDDLISPAIGSIARTPHFHANISEAMERLYELQRIHGPSANLSSVVKRLGLDDRKFDDIVETLWDLQPGEGLATLIEEGDPMWELVKAMRIDKDELKAIDILNNNFGMNIDRAEDYNSVVNYLQGRRSGFTTFRDAVMEDAMNTTIPFIDDHRVRSQFQGHVGSMMPFWFAEEAFIKRWARGFYENPAQLRRGQITMNGFRSMGFMQKDKYDNDVFVFPTTELAAITIAPFIERVMGAKAAMIVSQPLSVDVDFILPGVNENAPQGLQFGPGFAFGVNFMASRFPELSPVRDSLLGDMSANRWDPRADDGPNELWASVVEHFLPSQYANAMTALIPQMDANAFASAQAQSLQYMAAQGALPEENASPGEMEDFLAQSRNGARIILMTRAVSGFATGASMSPLWEIEESSKFQEMLDSGIDFIDAVDLIMETYGPDATVYTVFGTKSQSGAPVPSTAASLEFMQENRELINDFKFAMPWFIPQDVNEGEFGILERRARNEALAQELRVRKSPREILDGFYLRQAAPDYWESKDNYTAARLALQYNDQPVNELDDRWRQWRDVYLIQHPVFADDISTPDGAQRRRRTIDEARFLVSSPDLIPESDSKESMLVMMQSLVNFDDAMQSLAYNNTGAARDQRDQLRRDFFTMSSNYVLENPEVQQFYDSVVRPHIGLGVIDKIEFSNGLN